MSQPTAHHARHVPADESLARSVRYLSPASEHLGTDEITALCAEYDRARLDLWRTLGQPMLDALGLGPAGGGDPYRRPANDAVDDATLRAAARDGDRGFRLSRPLCRTAQQRAALDRAKRLRDRIALSMLGMAQAYARAHRGASHGGGRGLVLVAAGDDALQGALEQLLVALDRFAPERGVRFSTFAAHYLRHGVQNERFRAGAVTLPKSGVDRWAAAEDAERDLRQRLGRDPTYAEVAEEVGSAERVRTARATARVLHPADEFFALDDRGEPRHELVDDAPDPEAAAIASQEREHLRAAVDRALPRGTRRRVVAEVLAGGGTQADAAAAIGRRGTAARAVIRKARAALRRELNAAR